MPGDHDAMPRRPGANARIEPAVLPQVVLARDRPPGAAAADHRSGEYIRVARGIYMLSAVAADESPLELDRRRVLALIVGSHRRLSSSHWFSHTSAAMLWGLPLWNLPATTHVLSRGRAGSERGEWLTSHHGEVLPGELGTLKGLPVTSLARTVADCLLTLPPLDGLVVADAALHRGLEREALAAALAGRSARRGSARARAVLDVADDGAESPGESASRFMLLRSGLPAPTTQLSVRTRLGTYWADLGWEEWRLLVEYDGAVKYDSRSVLLAEKRRHDAMVEAGQRVIRVTHQDLTELPNRIVRFLPSSIQRSLRPRRDLAA
jgi:very-short-patch-repair endonuclease